jgi:hypothetical protein
MNIAGWYYAPEAKIFGRLLTREECWKQITHRLGTGKLTATIRDGEDVSYIVKDWPCLRFHVTRGEITLEEKDGAEPSMQTSVVRRMG